MRRSILNWAGAKSWLGSAGCQPAGGGNLPPRTLGETRGIAGRFHLFGRLAAKSSRWQGCHRRQAGSLRSPELTVRGFLLGCALLFSGCILGPHYTGPPNDPVPVAFKNSRHWKTAEPADTEPRGVWWKVFRDPVLDQLEEQAVSANQDLRLAAARIAEGRALSRVAAADFFPQINIDTQGERRRTSNTLPYQKGELIGSNPFGGGGSSGGAAPVISTQPLTTTQNDFRVPANLNWEIDLFGRVRNQYAAARAEAQAAKADFFAMQLSVAANVASQYFLLRSLDAEMDVFDRTIKTRRDSLNIAQERLQAGLTSELDVTRATAEVAGNEAARAAVERMRAQIENALATLLGRPASDFRMGRRPIDGRAPNIPAGLPSGLLERRPDVAAAERQLAAANARIGVARAAFFPRIRLTGAGGFESADLGLLFDAQSRFWEIGPSITLPIFEGGRNVANLRAAQARFEQAEARYRQQVLMAFQDVETALSDLRTLSVQAEAQQRAVRAEQRTLELGQKQYEHGAVNFLDVLDAERALLADQRTAAQLLGQQMQSTVQLIKALGGDWNE